MSPRAIFNLQIFACFCFVLFACVRAIRKPLPGARAEVSARRSHVILLLIALLTCIAFLPSLQDPLLSDDYILIHKSAAPAALWDTFTRPASDGAMRPVGELVFGAWQLWAREVPWKWHLLGLALHLANVALLYRLCGQLAFPPFADLFACALFALHPSHPEAVAWTSSTFDLLATLFSISALIALTFRSSYVFYTAAPVLTALAILSKESAYAIPAIALLFFAQRRKAAFVCVLVAAALLFHRWHVFQGPGGYLDPATGHAQILSVTTVSAAKTLLYRPWWTFLAPIDWAAPTSPELVVLLCLMYASLGAIAWKSRLAGSGRYLFLLAAAVIALVPPIHIALIGSDLQNTRVFYLPSVFFCLWFSQLPRHWALTGVAVLFSFFALRHNLQVRSDVAQAGGLACQAAATRVARQREDITVEELPRSLDGIYFFANGFPECVQALSGNPQAHVVVNTGLHSPVLRWNLRRRALEAHYLPTK